LHGPTELLPVSSSGHITLVPWLMGWPYGELDPQLRKSFEVALHAGTAAALLLRPLWRSPAGSNGESGTPARIGARIGFLSAALTPPALTGYALGGQVERRLGTPATIAAGLLAGSVAMGAAEMYARKGCPACVRARTQKAPFFETHTTQTHHGVAPPARATRTVAKAGWRDGLALGLAQSFALFPGLSRNGATLAAARARGFSPLDADRLSWHVGLPVIAGAAALKGTQIASAGVPRELRLPLAAGAASALLSTLTSARVLRPRRRAGLLPACAAYRGMLALLVIRRMRDNTSQPAPILKTIKRSHSPTPRKGILRRSRLQS
jgi:undecaprenyl-diphosphatase